MRKSWDEYFFDVAKMVSTRSTCPRAAIGAVLVDRHHRIISTGYNGAPSNVAHCDEIGCVIVDDHCVATVHAEENCLTPELTLEQMDGAIMYVHGPRQCCDNCMNLLNIMGITDIKERYLEN